MTYFRILFTFATIPSIVLAFVPGMPPQTSSRPCSFPLFHSNPLNVEQDPALSTESSTTEVDTTTTTTIIDPKVAEKFKIVTCMSTSCTERRKRLGMDPLETFSALYSRIHEEENTSVIRIEEGPCLGSCKYAPCVAIEHDDFIGSVALEGMHPNEFDSRAYVSSNTVYICLTISCKA